MSGVALLLAQQDEPVLFLGEDFMPWMVLALGAALVVGNAFALIRPPKEAGRSSRAAAGRAPRATGTPSRGATVERPPILRAVIMIVVGLVAAGWGLASLLS